MTLDLPSPGLSEAAAPAFNFSVGSEAKDAKAPAHNGIGLPLRFREVTRAFGSLEVLKGITLDIPNGQFLAIVGRSGGGKTTMLRLAAGLDLPSSGDVIVGDQLVKGLQSQVRLLFQDARLLPWQSVIGNVGIARGKGWKDTAREALAHVGLAGRENDWPAVLSGGQRQRVALARALVSRPGILLLDEPFGALDALTRLEMHALTERIWEEYRFTTVLITHDVAEAVALADRVLVLRDGDIALDIPISLPRPRREHTDPIAAEIQARILKEV
jgi:sulfonate transport system ATP-binding protein